MSGQQQLTLGALDLLGDNGSGLIEALGDDGTWGAPQAIEVTLQSLLQDGSVVVTQGYDNREASLRVRLTADDSNDLASLEAMLFRELGKRNTLTWTPPDGWGPPTVFEVITSRMEHTFDDLSEVLRVQRTYGVTLVCEPFARSQDPFTVTGSVASDTSGTPPPPTTINDGTSATNWTYSATPTASGSELSGFSVNPILKYAYKQSGIQTEHWYEYASTFSVGSQKFLALDWQVSGPGAYMVDVSPSAMVNNTAGSTTGGVALVRAGQINSPDNPGYTRTLFVIPASVTTISRIRFYGSMNATNANTTTAYQRGFSVRLVQLTSQPLSSGTTRQKTMTVKVPGSAPTVGSLQVSHPSTALGDLLVYSWRDDGCGYAPPMRGYRTSGGTITPDSTLYSGASDSLATTLTYDVPTRQLPAGLYVMYARLKRTAAGTSTIRVDAGTFTADGATQLPGGWVTSQQTLSLTTTWTILPVGRLMLPTVDAGPNGKARLTVQNPGDGTVSLDELYLCNATIGRTTLLNARSLGTTPAAGGAPSIVWINSPTTDNPRPSVKAGTQADGSDAYNIESLVSASQPHRWEAGAQAVFTACNALDARTTLTGYPRWHTHAADDKAA